MQQVLIGLLFGGALIYLGVIIFRHFKSESSCQTGCGKCGVDFSDIEMKIKDKERVG